VAEDGAAQRSDRAAQPEEARAVVRSMRLREMAIRV
jgi:hypothetical protein